MEQNFFFEYASSYKVHLSRTDKNLAQLEFFFYLIIVWPWGVKSAPCPLCNSTYHVIGYLIICVHAVYTMIRSLASFVLPEHHCDLENPHPIGNNIPIWKSNNNLHNFKIAHTHKNKINVPRLLKKSCPPLSQRGKKSRKFLLAPQHLNSFFLIPWRVRTTSGNKLGFSVIKDAFVYSGEFWQVSINRWFNPVNFFFLPVTGQIQPAHPPSSMI